MSLIYNQFLENILHIVGIERYGIVRDEYVQLEIWKYTCELLLKHSKAIEALLMIWYIPDNIFLRETLSGDYPIFYMHEIQKFEESYWSWKSDLVPSITFHLSGWEEDEVTPILRLELSDSNIAWID